MRITGGQAKGRLLATPKGLHIRPTTDRVREAIFDIIGQDLSGLRVLDLFAGTGSLGLEALSRGANRALFIDNAQLSIRIIRKNLSRCGYQEKGIVLKRDIWRGIPTSHPFFDEGLDLVFMDPPYKRDYITPLLERFSTGRLFRSGARLIAESTKLWHPPALEGDIHLLDTRVYGDTRISIYAYGVKDE